MIATASISCANTFLLSLIVCGICSQIVSNFDQQITQAVAVNRYEERAEMERTVGLMYDEWMVSKDLPYIEMPNTCASILHAFKKFGICQAIRSANMVDFKSSNRVVFGNPNAMISEKSLKAYTEFVTHQPKVFPFSSEMQLYMLHYDVIPDFFIVYAQRGLMEHVIGALAYASRSDIDVFNDILISGSGSALHGAMTAYIAGFPNLNRQSVMELWESDAFEACHLSESNLWNCLHGMGHAFIHWFAAKRQARATPTSVQPCSASQILYGSLHLDRSDLEYAVLVCSWLAAMVGACASGSFHVYYRSSYEFALEISQQVNKLSYINTSLCNLFETSVRTICFGQASNAASGDYILFSDNALGLNKSLDIANIKTPHSCPTAK